jgi:hypothetical protein
VIGVLKRRKEYEGSDFAMGMEWSSMFSLSATLNRYHGFIRYYWLDAAGVKFPFFASQSLI